MRQLCRAVLALAHHHYAVVDSHACTEVFSCTMRVALGAAVSVPDVHCLTGSMTSNSLAEVLLCFRMTNQTQSGVCTRLFDPSCNPLERSYMTAAVPYVCWQVGALASLKRLV